MPPTELRLRLTDASLHGKPTVLFSLCGGASSAVENPIQSNPIQLIKRNRGWVGAGRSVKLNPLSQSEKGGGARHQLYTSASSQETSQIHALREGRHAKDASCRVVHYRQWLWWYINHYWTPSAAGGAAAAAVMEQHDERWWLYIPQVTRRKRLAFSCLRGSLQLVTPSHHSCGGI